MSCSGNDVDYYGVDDNVDDIGEDDDDDEANFDGATGDDIGSGGCVGDFVVTLCTIVFVEPTWLHTSWYMTPPPRAARDDDDDAWATLRLTRSGG